MADPLYADLGVREPRQRPREFDLEALKNSVDNQFTIGRYDRWYRFDGFDVQGLLFELISVRGGRRVAAEARFRQIVANRMAQEPRIVFNQHRDLRIEVLPRERTVNLYLNVRPRNLTDRSFERAYQFNAS